MIRHRCVRQLPWTVHDEIERIVLDLGRHVERPVPRHPAGVSGRLTAPKRFDKQSADFIIRDCVIGAGRLICRNGWAPD